MFEPSKTHVQLFEVFNTTDQNIVQHEDFILILIDWLSRLILDLYKHG